MHVTEGTGLALISLRNTMRLNLSYYLKVARYKWEPLIIQGYCLQVSYFRAQQYLVFLHMSNALLVTAVHVKMKLWDNTAE